ncbi:MAG: hypothetical protein ACD_75C00867G0002 [uncultured bacterium]|nr:MAG: hypothetical protein ACD_75C00867G0002 [uncultured bacterium]
MLYDGFHRLLADLIEGVRRNPLFSLEHLPSHGKEGREVFASFKNRFPCMSRDGRVEFRSVAADHPGIACLSDLDDFEVPSGQGLKIDHDSDRPLEDPLLENGNMESNRGIPLNGSEYITDDRFKRAHDLLDMFLGRDIPSDHILVIGDCVYNPPFGIDTRYPPNLIEIYVIIIVNGFPACLIQVDDMAHFRQDGQNTRPLCEKIFDSTGGLHGMK